MDEDFEESGVFVNDLETLDATFLVTKVLVLGSDILVKGIQLEHSKGVVKPHGTCVGKPSHVWDLTTESGPDIIVEVVVREAVNSERNTVISSIAFVTAKCRVFDSATKPNTTTTSQKALPPSSAGPAESKPEESKNPNPRNQLQKSPNPKNPNKPSPPPPLASPPTIVKITTLLPPTLEYSLRGLFTISDHPTRDLPSGIPCSLGIIWSKDSFVPIPSLPISLPIIKLFLSLGRPLSGNVSRLKTQTKFAPFSAKFLVGVNCFRQK
ncbi:hypothetical protein QBC38DRAFT_525207 [Podospora fimiseda]|uniref:Uncharacterized protein n=1 Tax=Podospora fimiseda TaxID=252190 RepID=A0AAN6YQU5_9PEZI|nr:hypothetical protein QBC38DRAFT_525207 [Podospora fimiseda]